MTSRRSYSGLFIGSQARWSNWAKSSLNPISRIGHVSCWQPDSSRCGTPFKLTVPSTNDPQRGTGRLGRHRR